MNHFKLELVGPEALQINFIQPYTDSFGTDIKDVLEKMGAVSVSSHHNSYMDEYVTWYKIDNLTFTFSDLWGNLSIYAQGDNELIYRLEKALLDSGKFTKD